MKPGVIFVVAAAVMTFAIYFRGGSFTPAMREDGERDASVARSSRILSLPDTRLSKREILEALPERLPYTHWSNGLTTSVVELPRETTQEVKNLLAAQVEASKLFRQWGALEGEAALDAIFERYYQEDDQDLAMDNNLAFFMLAALSGWLENDFDGAVAAYQKLMRLDQPGSQWQGTMMLFAWKGVEFCRGMT